MIYLDNAATSGTKPETVYQAADRALRSCSGNPGRSGHAVSVAAGRIVEDCRVKLARFFGADDASEISFAFNTTMALNTAICGVVKPGSHVITSALEHNSVSRPLEHLKSLGVRVSVLPASVDLGVDPDALKRSLTADTSLVVMTHVSNVTGTVNDISAIGAICREHGIPFLVDAAQSAGARTIDVRKSCVDMLAFPGHKGLLGPQGTGGLYIRGDLPVEPLLRGGTGSFSERPEQPSERPSGLESGTLNVPGLAGLSAGVSYLEELGLEQVFAHEQALRRQLLEEMREIPGIRLYAPSPDHDGGCVVSFTMEAMEPSDAAFILDASFGIAVRAGLHCAPYAHGMLGTLQTGGTVRVSPGIFTTPDEISRFTGALREILAGTGGMR